MTELQTKWIEALRSGKYKQGKYGLKQSKPAINDVTYCCLGVLCDIVEPEGWIIKSSGDGEIIGGVIGEDYSTSFSILPYRIRQAVGISKEFQSSLIHANDCGYSFKHIASMIESEVKYS